MVLLNSLSVAQTADGSKEIILFAKVKLNQGVMPNLKIVATASGSRIASDFNNQYQYLYNHNSKTYHYLPPSSYSVYIPEKSTTKTNATVGQIHTLTIRQI